MQLGYRLKHSSDPCRLHDSQRLSAAEVSHHVHFTACMLVGKLGLSASSTLLVEASAPIYLLFCIGMLNLFLYVNNQVG